MKGLGVVGALVLGLSLAACTTEQVYTKIQQDRALECQQYPDSRYDDCMAQLSGPYDEYQESLPEKGSGPAAAPTGDRAS